MTTLEQSLRTSGEHISYWIASTKPIRYPKLRQNEQADVVVVGGGIAGVSVAYSLVQEGKKVILLEDGFIGSGESGRTTAHLVSALDDRYESLEKLFGKDGARMAAESNIAALDFIEEVIKKENISCGFKRVDGYLFRHPSDKQNSLDEEYEAARRVGLDVQKLPHIPGFKNGDKPCLKFGNQGQFHSLLYLEGLCKAIENGGGKIYCETHVEEIEEDGVTTSDGLKVNAAAVVVATNSPVNNKFAIHIKQFAYRTYVIGVLVKKGTVPQALWWDTGDVDTNPHIPPYHYVRTQEFNDTYDLLLVGGEDHPTGLADVEEVPEESRYDHLEEWARRHFSFETIQYKWSGQVMEPMDKLAYIGRNPYNKNIYVVTGDSGNGMTSGTIAGILISDLITGRKNDWEKLYDPGRFKILKAGNVFLKEFIGGFFAYLKHNPKHTDEIELSSIETGEGKIIEINGQKFGAYHDEEGNYLLVNAECTHLGCIVKWNNDEKSWDCPCHGSRFTVDGHILNGPATKELFFHKEGAHPHVIH